MDSTWRHKDVSDLAFYEVSCVQMPGSPQDGPKKAQSSRLSPRKSFIPMLIAENTHRFIKVAEGGQAAEADTYETS